MSFPSAAVGLRLQQQQQQEQLEAHRRGAALSPPLKIVTRRKGTENQRCNGWLHGKRRCWYNVTAALVQLGSEVVQVVRELFNLTFSGASHCCRLPVELLQTLLQLW